MKHLLYILLVCMAGCASTQSKQNIQSAGELTNLMLDRLDRASLIKYESIDNESDFYLLSRMLTSCSIANEKYAKMPSVLSGNAVFKKLTTTMGEIYNITLYQLVRRYLTYEGVLKNGVRQGSEDTYTIMLRSERTGEDIESLIHSINKECIATFKNRLESAIDLKSV